MALLGSGGREGGRWASHGEARQALRLSARRRSSGSGEANSKGKMDSRVVWAERTPLSLVSTKLTGPRSACRPWG